MLDQTSAEEAVRAAAEAYCVALHNADIAALTEIFAETSHLYAAQDGALIEWPRQVFLDRNEARGPCAGAPDFEIHDVQVAGPEMAQARLSVSVPPRRFTDYLNFLLIDGRWRVIAKIFRVADGPKL